ncbi:MAG: HAD family phosphatase [Dehalococcoidales bacterium]|nr:MAG: HAD family phosphatase [Dehalococcoidales bacterium]
MSQNNNRAVIWDMDGVIVDTASYHRKAWQEVFSKQGILFTEDDFRHSFGQRNDTIIKEVMGAEVSPDILNTISSEKEVIFRESIRQNLRPLPGAVELMAATGKDGFLMALASSAPMENIRLLIEGLGIEKYFRSIISAGDVSRGKPDPQVFLLAARGLEIDPRSCIVIEDAVAGVSAAKRAGMHCVAVTNTHPRASLIEADLIVSSLTEITVKDLKRLFSQS